MKNFEAVPFTDSNLRLIAPNPPVAVELDPGSDIAIASLLFAIDASQRKPELRSAEDAAQLAVTRESCSLPQLRAAGIRPDILDDTPYESAHPESFYTLGKVFHQALGTDNAQVIPSHRPSGVLHAGRNQFGDMAIVRGFGTTAPSGVATTLLESHWRDAFLDMTKISENTLAVSLSRPPAVFQPAKQLLTPDMLRNELAAEALATFMAADPGVRVSDVQPITISGLQYEGTNEEGIAAKGLALGALYAFIDANKQDIEVASTEPMRSPTYIDTSLSILDRHSDLGTRLNVKGWTNKPDSRLRLEEDESGLTLANDTNQLTNLTIKLEPIVWTSNGQAKRCMRSLETFDTLATPARLEAAERINASVQAIRQALIAGNA